MKIEDEFSSGKSAEEVEGFLGRCLKEYGEKSVINIWSVLGSSSYLGVALTTDLVGVQ